jgi:hypothetical protein
MYARILALLVTYLICAPNALASAEATTARQLDFDVFLDERPIGYQRFALVPLANGVRVETQAEFAVKILGITAFEYAHRNVEQWRGRCLQSIESSTDSNGTRYRVSGRAQGDGFLLAGDDQQRRLAQCVGTFAYWDRTQLLGRDRLLNSQTGDHVAVEVLPAGTRALRLGGREFQVEQYKLRGQDIDIMLSYAVGSGEWLALDSRLEGGRVLRYRRSIETEMLAQGG